MDSLNINKCLTGNCNAVPEDTGRKFGALYTCDVMTIVRNVPYLLGRGVGIPGDPLARRTGKHALILMPAAYLTPAGLLAHKLTSLWARVLSPVDSSTSMPCGMGPTGMKAASQLTTYIP
jgi:hypothetical protein